MGWADCGTNSTTGEEMGYAFEGVCAEPGCKRKIDHGLAHVCGDMHEDPNTCQRYYCYEHLFHSEVYNIGPGGGLCKRCHERLEAEMEDTDAAGRT